MPHEPPLTLHPVATAEQGKIRPPDAPGLGMDRGGAGGAVTAAEVVQRDDKEMSGVDGLAGTNIGIPPARAPVLPGMVARSVVMARQGMADEHRIAALGIELAIGFIQQLEDRKSVV